MVVVSVLFGVLLLCYFSPLLCSNKVFFFLYFSSSFIFFFSIFLFPSLFHLPNISSFHSHTHLMPPSGSPTASSFLPFLPNQPIPFLSNHPPSLPLLPYPPVHPEAHWQLKDPTVLIHLPPFLQGFPRHSLTSSEHVTPL